MNGIPEVEIQFEKTAVVANSRKLAAKWTVEFDQDIQAMFGLGLELLGKEVVVMSPNNFKIYGKDFDYTNRVVAVEYKKNIRVIRENFEKVDYRLTRGQFVEKFFVDLL